MKRVWEHISVDPNICHGKPCIKGTRILVSVMLGAIAAGASFDEIIEEFPPITRVDIQASIQYAALLADEQYVPLEAIFTDYA